MANFISEQIIPFFLKRLIPIAVIGIISVSCIYIFSGKPHIHISSDSLIFKAHDFRQCEIAFLNSVMIRSYGISPPIPQNADASTLAPIHLEQVGHNVLSLIITNSYQAIATTSADKLYTIYVNPAPSLTFDVSSISIDNKQIDLKTFLAGNLEGRGEFVRNRYMRDDLANFILLFNRGIDMTPPDATPCGVRGC